MTSPAAASGDDVGCAPRLELLALPGLPILQPGDDLAGLLAAALTRAELTVRAGDVLVVASKLVSRAEGGAPFRVSGPARQRLIRAQEGERDALAEEDASLGLELVERCLRAHAGLTS